MAMTIPAYPQRSIFRYIANEYEYNNALRSVEFREVGFDTEFTEPAPVVAAHADRWEHMKLRLIQLAIPGVVFIIDVKLMKAIPHELRRILEARHIAKVSVGLPIDGRIIFEADGIDLQNLVDVGLMTKFSNPEAYPQQDQTSLGLQICVKDVLGYHLSKSEQSRYKWQDELSEGHILYAGLDAQASLEVYSAIKPAFYEKAYKVVGGIPEHWYTFDFTKGKPTRQEKSREGKVIPWSARFCTWYNGGRFQGYV
ncbi:ribonuclease H-like domain-containing protein [Mycena maculata]|uniref:Ribonuclease H-like domain-containing protein n=1 Tax=Mycena maculata TaxID=230809 RepID=A0AAD7HMF1_9AGAR|nr:ribonuclease H-like domain-containing protein [Mycena maculata]